MTRQLPALATRLEHDIDRALSIATAGDVIRARARPGSVYRRQLTLARLEALYEMAFLRVFLAWERFLEETLVRLICGYQTAAGPVTLVNPAYPNIASANAALSGNRGYASLADPSAVVRSSRRYIVNGPHELVINSNSSRIDWFRLVRHRVAHHSEFSRTNFDQATTGLAGRRYIGKNPGKFLRDFDANSTPPARWLYSIGEELKALALQIAP